MAAINCRCVQGINYMLESQMINTSTLSSTVEISIELSIFKAIEML